LTQASAHHSAKVTPYGPVVQQLDLGTEGPIDYVNPFAYLYYLSSICHAFGDMLVGCMRGIEPLRLVIYISTRSVQATHCVLTKAAQPKPFIGVLRSGLNGCYTVLPLGCSSALCAHQS